MSTDSRLGEKKFIDLSQGKIHYRESGKGDPLVFIHGALLNGDYWRNVVPELNSKYRCISPDLPLGSHTEPMKANTDFTPLGLAKLIRDFLKELKIEKATLIANDTGGAITQVLMQHFPESVGRIILTSCDAFEHFPPPIFFYFKILPWIPGSLWLMSKLVRFNFLLNLPFVLGLLSKYPGQREIFHKSYSVGLQSSLVRRDLSALLAGASSSYTLEAAKSFPSFKKPVLIAWAEEDRVFLPSMAKRLHSALPNSTLVWMKDCYAFIPEDQPKELARVIHKFLEENRL